MNLIQIQDELKGFPLQTIMSYANGSNPEVPPYMALGELNRRKMSEQRKAEPPTQSVKEKLESQFRAPQMPPQMPQGMPQGAQQMPQGIAQLPGAQMPQGMPQGAPQAPPAIASGGLAELPVRDDMFHYAPGGIVAFAAGDLVRGPGGEIIPEDDRAGEAEARAGVAAADQSQGPPVAAMPASGLASLEGPATAAIARAIRGDTDEPMPKDPELIRKEILNKNPELAKLVNTIPGAELAKLSTRLQAQNEASKTQFKEGQGRMGLAGLANALIAAGEATRGHKGLGFGEAMGGFGKSYGKFTEEDVKRQQAQQALERQQEIEVSKLDADIETLRQAYAKAQIDGRTADAANFLKAIADRAARKQTLQVGASEKALTMANTQEQMRGTLAHYKATEENEKNKLIELSRNNADQAVIERQKLEVQKAMKNSQLVLDRERLEALIESRPSANDKKIRAVEANLAKPNTDFAEANKRIATLTAEELDAPIGKYYRSIRDKARADAYKRAGLPEPEASTLPTYESFQPSPVEEPGFFSRMFGGSSTPAPKVIKLD